MTFAQRAYLKAEISRRRQAHLRQLYGTRNYLSVADRIDRELIDRARTTYLDVLAAGAAGVAGRAT